MGTAAKKPKKVPVPKKPAAKKAGKRGAAPAADGGHDGPSSKALDTVLTEVTASPEREHVEQWMSVQCPYCGEEFEVHVTSEDEGQTLTEDCHVCCRPVSLHVHYEEDELQISAYRS